MKKKKYKITIYNFASNTRSHPFLPIKLTLEVPRDFDIQGQKGNQLMLVEIKWKFIIQIIVEFETGVLFLLRKERTEKLEKCHMVVTVKSQES